MLLFDMSCDIPLIVKCRIAVFAQVRKWTVLGMNHILMSFDAPF